MSFLGSGNDEFVWGPRDGSDTVEGPRRHGRLRFNGSNANEDIDISASGQRLRFSRDVANVTTDANGLGTVDVRALGGADVVTVHDLTGTAVSAVTVDLPGPSEGPPATPSPTRSSWRPRPNVDDITVIESGSSANVNGLVPMVHISPSEGANDRLDINTLAGSDSVDSAGLAPGVIQLFVDGVAQ